MAQFFVNKAIHKLPIIWYMHSLTALIEYIDIVFMHASKTRINFEAF